MRTGCAVLAVVAVLLLVPSLVVRPGPSEGQAGPLGRRGLPWVDAGAPPRDWAVVVCDVGQGEALLLRAGPSAAVVVDTGPEPRTLSRCLERASVRTVPLLVLTHLHADHVGGLAALDPGVVERLWTPPGDQPAESAAALAEWSADGRHASGCRQAPGPAPGR